jgi:hypothetical protein
MARPDQRSDLESTIKQFNQNIETQGNMLLCTSTFINTMQLTAQFQSL